MFCVSFHIYSVHFQSEIQRFLLGIYLYSLVFNQIYNCLQLPRWYVARLFQICSASVDYKIKPEELEPVRNCEIFCMNNNLDYKRIRRRDLTNECNVSFPRHKFSNLIQ